MKIQLTKGRFAIVDADDFDKVAKYSWQYGYNGYAATRTYLGNYKWGIIYMHRLINNTPDGIQTDHINRNRLDNRKINLRNVNPSINAVNRGRRSDNTSGSIGVSRVKNGWVATICRNKIKKYLGYFNNLEDAILERKKAEAQYHVFG